MSRDERYAAFLFYVEDWLSSTAIEIMTPGEERGYLRLLLHAWKTPDCGLPNDDKVLAQLSKLGRAWYSQSGAVVRAQFSERNGRLYNERLLRERENQRRVRHVRSQAGRSGADSRWHSGRSRDTIANASLSQWQTECQNDPSSSSSTNKNTKLEAASEVEKERLLQGCYDASLTREEWARLYEVCSDQEIEDRVGSLMFEDEPRVGVLLEAEIERQRALGREIPPEEALQVVLASLVDAYPALRAWLKQ